MKKPLILILLSGFISILNVSLTSASSEWSWIGQQPELISQQEVNNAPLVSDNCDGIWQNRQIEGEIGLVKVCLTVGDNVSFGYYSSPNSSSFNKVVGFRNDAKLYKLSTSICSKSYNNRCIYLPSRDILIYRQTISTTPYGTRLRIYRNFSLRLSRKSLIPGIGIEYQLSTDNPEYVLDTPTIGAAQASDNQRWLAVEFIDRGIGVLDLETFTLKRITRQAYKYWQGANPTTELAVSNDGQSVAVMGLNSGLTVYEVKNCGDLVENGDNLSEYTIGSACKYTHINARHFYPLFEKAHNPRFDSEGGELEFYVTSLRNQFLPQKVTVRATDYQPIRLDYLALGDSYSSGEGELDNDHYLPNTNNGVDKCHISDRSYPFLLADLQGFDLSLTRSVACSGARTYDVIKNETEYFGQKSRLGEVGYDANEDDLESFYAQALLSFMPGWTEQISFVDKYQPKVITVGIGGNDANLVNKLVDCATPGTCNWAKDPIKIEQVAYEIRSLFTTLTEAYKQLIESSPNSKIYAIGYPKIISSSNQCDWFHGLLFDQTEREFINQSIAYLNQVISAAAQASGIGFIDIENIYGEQALCGQVAPSAINGIVLGDDINLILLGIGNESLHPNQYGHALTADYINKIMPDLKSYDYCEDGRTNCFNEFILAPEPSSFWLESNHNYPRLIASEFLSSSDLNSPKLEINLPNQSLQSNSIAEIEVTSDPISLGEFIVDQDGSLSTQIILPEDLESGYHTIHIYANSYGDEPIELYQMIGYNLSSSSLAQTNTDDSLIDNDLILTDNAKNHEITTNYISASQGAVLSETETRSNLDKLAAQTDDKPVVETKNKSNPIFTIIAISIVLSLIAILILAFV